MPTDVPQAAHLHVLLDPAAVLAAYAGHRRRFAAAAEGLDAAALALPSRCGTWTVADVLRHGLWVDDALARMWSGDLAVMEGFDPRTTPDVAVEASRTHADTEIRDRFVASSVHLAEVVAGTGVESWDGPAVTPAGHLPWWMSVLHAFYDSSIHERDVLLPTSTGPGAGTLAPAVELEAVLAWSLALAGFFVGPDPIAVEVAGVGLTTGHGPVVVGPGRHGDGPVQVLVGEQEAVIDALSGRGRLVDVLQGDPTTRDRLGGLALFLAPA